MKRRLVLTMAALAISLAATAQITDKKHEIRVGVGENTMQTIAFRDSPHASYVNLTSGTYKESRFHHYIPHFFVEYNYNFKSWLSFGGQMDLSGFTWTDCFYQAGSDTVTGSEGQDCVNVCLMPQVKFNWLRKKYFTMYSAVRCGIDINTGTETDVYGKKTVCAFAIAPALIGISAGKGRFFGACELSPILAARGSNMVYLPFSRIVSISGGIRF